MPTATGVASHPLSRVRSDSTVSLADAADAAASGGIRDPAAPGQSASRTRPIRSVEESGAAPILFTPFFNKGTVFTAAERRLLGIEGLLPPAVETLDAQAARVLAQLRTECAGPLERYSRLSWLASTNVALFYYVLINNLDELAPVIYTPTVGVACQRFSLHYRHPMGVFCDAIHGRDRFRACLSNWPNHAAQVAVVTDGSRILGLGDLGVGGMGISIGKVQLYCAAGFYPEHSIPILLDAGTNNEAALADPYYLGVRKRRLSDAEVVDAVADLAASLNAQYPGVLLQFEDFASEKAFAILERLRDKCLCFNDDIQGTGAVVCAGFLNGMRARGTPLSEARVAFFGAGSSAVGVAETIAAAVAADTGESVAQARGRIYLIDSKGLVTATRGDTLPAHKQGLARTDGTPDMAGLVDIISAVRPHALIGLSGVGGAFTRDALTALAAVTPRPLVMPCSNPTSCAECEPGDVYAACGPGALVATGSPFDAVTLPDGTTKAPVQANNCHVFPGVGLGAVLSRASRVSDGMLLAAARAVAAAVPQSDLDAGILYPPVAAMRATSLRVAVAVAAAAWDEGVATARRPALLVRYVADRLYWPGGVVAASWEGVVAALEGEVGEA